MKNVSYYIQPVNVNKKPTTCEIIRNILWYIAQLTGCIAVFAIMYIIIIVAYVI